MGGLYHPVTKTFTILTTSSNPMMSKVHNSALRQVVIIAGLETMWLQQNLSPEEFHTFCEPIPEEWMAHHTVSKMLTARGADRNTPDLSKPFAYPELEQST
jgi:putative SOS response-associated peptidase YedK